MKHTHTTCLLLSMQVLHTVHRLVLNRVYFFFASITKHSPDPSDSHRTSANNKETVEKKRIEIRTAASAYFCMARTLRGLPVPNVVHDTNNVVVINTVHIKWSVIIFKIDYNRLVVVSPYQHDLSAFIQTKKMMIIS